MLIGSLYFYLWKFYVICLILGVGTLELNLLILFYFILTKRFVVMFDKIIFLLI